MFFLESLILRSRYLLTNNMIKNSTQSKMRGYIKVLFMWRKTNGHVLGVVMLNLIKMIKNFILHIYSVEVILMEQRFCC